jgi:hypothetical protein
MKPDHASQPPYGADGLARVEVPWAALRVRRRQDVDVEPLPEGIPSDSRMARRDAAADTAPAIDAPPAGCPCWLVDIPRD